MPRPSFTEDEAYRAVEETLRPTAFADFVGQRQVVDNLQIAVRAARKRREPLAHVLLTGFPGLGKTTLARILAHEMRADLRTTSGPVLKRPGDLAAILTKLGHGDVLFIDEVHRMSADAEEFLYSAMEDFVIHITLDKGMNARAIHLPLKRFTLVGATTREGLLSAPFLSRFVIAEKLDLYPVQEMREIVGRSAALLKVDIDEEAIDAVASRSRGTPRFANRLLFRLRDLAQVRGDGRISARIAQEGFRRLGVDSLGLEETHRKMLRLLASHRGLPTGLKTISANLGEDPQTLEDVYEPYLLQQDLIVKSPRGRRITERGARHIGATDIKNSLF